MKTQTLVLGGLAAAAAWFLWPKPTQGAANTGGASPPATGGAKPAGQVFLTNAGISCSEWLAMTEDRKVAIVLMKGVSPLNAAAVANSITASCLTPTYYPYWWGWGGGGGFRGRGHHGHGGHGGHWGGGGGHGGHGK